MHMKHDVIWKKTPIGSMLFNVRTEERLELNSIATDIFLSYYVNRLNRTDIQDLFLASFPDIQKEVLRSDVEHLINSLESSPLFTDEDDDWGFINLLDTQPGLDSLIIEVTGRCNLSCIHCFEGGSRDNKGLPFEFYEDLAKQLKDMKVLRVVLTGGEPFMRPDLSLLTKAFTSNGIKVVIFTNGTLLRPWMLEEFQPGLVLLRFSLEGADAETNDRIRGQGVFDSTMNSIKMAKKYGLDIGLSFTLYKENWNQFWTMLELANSLEVTESEISDVRAFGNAVSNSVTLLNKDQKVQLRILTVEAAKKYLHFRRGMGFANSSRLAKMTGYKRTQPCNAGISSAYIDGEGNVYPCLLFRDKQRFCAGSILNTSLRKIWLESAVFKPFRNVNMDSFLQCESCIAKAICAGGCRALAIGVDEDFYGPMDQTYCTVSQEVASRLQQGELNYLLENKSCD